MVIMRHIDRHGHKIRSFHIGQSFFYDAGTDSRVFFHLRTKSGGSLRFFPPVRPVSNRGSRSEIKLSLNTLFLLSDSKDAPAQNRDSADEFIQQKRAHKGTDAHEQIDQHFRRVRGVFVQFIRLGV